jgi:hypothetical protein
MRKDKRENRDAAFKLSPTRKHNSGPFDRRGDVSSQKRIRAKMNNRPVNLKARGSLDALKKHAVHTGSLLKEEKSKDMKDAAVLITRILQVS